MVCELHKLGYQRLRVMPYFHPLAWRLAIGPVEQFTILNGAFAPDADPSLVTYSSASGNSYFDWKDANADTARQIAEKFIERFADVAERGRGRDWAYAGWLSELLGHLERTATLPFVMEEFYSTPPDELQFLPLWDREHFTNGGRFDLPPPGVRP